MANVLSKQEKVLKDMYQYIRKVMVSCKTLDQLDNAYAWGKKVLREKAYFFNFDTSSLKALSISLAADEALDSLLGTYATVSQNIVKVKEDGNQ